MKNFVQSGNVITAIAPVAIKSGAPVLIGHLFGIAAHDAAAGEEVELATTGVFDLPIAAVSVTAGAVAYIDADNGVLTTVSAAGPRVGVFIADSIGRVRLDGAAT